MDKQTWITIAVVLGVVAIIIVASVLSTPKGSDAFDEFAMCLEEQGATFYGTFWCPYCQEQKKMFGSSAKFLPYTECSTPDGKAQTQECTDADITGYPTWEFADGERLTGLIPMQTLADRTGCEIPRPEE